MAAERATGLRIGMAVHGRFHAFDLAQGLLQNGHEVTLLTNYPRSIAARFGVPAERVRSMVRHGAVARAAARLLDGRADRWLHPWFGRWAAQQLGGATWDVTHIWSGVAAEWLEHPTRTARCALERGSAHIRAQRELLDEEERRVGVALHKPSDWMIGREEQEYARADLIVVPSRYAQQTFVERGVPADRLRIVPLLASSASFRAPADVVEARRQRVQQGGALRVLFVGALSYQKGLHDLLQVMEMLPPTRFHFRLVGQLTAECAPSAGRLARRAELIGKVPQAQLPQHYAWADLLVLPSIQDGFAVVLSQAVAAGVPFIASTHSGGPDLVAAGVPGWIVEPRAADRLAERLLAVAADRAELARRVHAVQAAASPHDWSAVAREFVREVMR